MIWVFSKRPEAIGIGVIAGFSIRPKADFLKLELNSQ